MKKQLFRYWVGMNASALQAGIHATKAFVATASAHALVDKIPSLSLEQTAAVFALAFGVEILNWLDTHPLLEVLNTSYCAKAPEAKTPA